MWNSNELIPPPTNTCMIKSHSLDINVLQRVSRESCQLLKATKVLEMEHHLLSRCIYKLKLQFRNDKALKLMIIVNKSLKTCIGFKMDKDISHFFESIPNTYKNNSYFPSQQMLDYLLVRMQGYSKILCRTAECSITVAEYMNSRLKLGHFVALTIFILCVVSRIWQVCKTFIVNVCSWYNSLLPLRKTLQLCGIPWLPTDYQFPEDLFEWLKAEWLYDTPFLLTKLQIELPIFTLLDETEDEVQFVNQYKLDDFFVIDDDNSDDSIEFLKKQHSTSVIHISEDKSDIEILSDVENDENLVYQTELRCQPRNDVQEIDEDETVPISDEDIGESISRDLLSVSVNGRNRVEDINKTDVQEIFNSSTSDVEIIEYSNETPKNILKSNDVKTIDEIDNTVSHDKIKCITNNIEIIEISDKTQTINESELSKKTQRPNKEKTTTLVNVSKNKTKKKILVKKKKNKINNSKDIYSSTEYLCKHNENTKDKTKLNVSQTSHTNNDILSITKIKKGKKQKSKTNRNSIGLNSSKNLPDINTKKKIEKSKTKKKLSRRNPLEDISMVEESYDDINNEKHKSPQILNKSGNCSLKLVVKSKEKKIKKLKRLSKEKPNSVTENKKTLKEKETTHIKKNLDNPERKLKRSIGVLSYNNAKTKQKLDDEYSTLEILTAKKRAKLPKTPADFEVIDIASDNSTGENSKKLNSTKTKKIKQFKCDRKSDSSFNVKKEKRKISQNFLVLSNSDSKNQEANSSSEISVVENKKKKAKGRKSSNNSVIPKLKKRKLEENTKFKETSDSEDSANIQIFTENIRTSVAKPSRKRKLSATEIDSSYKGLKKATSSITKTLNTDTSGKDSDMSVISILDESNSFSPKNRKLFTIKKRNLKNKSNRIKKLMNSSVWCISDTDSSTIIN